MHDNERRGNEDLRFEEFWDTHTDVKPCPFCGGSDEKLTINRRANKRPPHNYYYFLKCEVCRASSGSYTEIEASYAHWQARAAVVDGA